MSWAPRPFGTGASRRQALTATAAVMAAITMYLDIIDILPFRFELADNADEQSPLRQGLASFLTVLDEFHSGVAANLQQPVSRTIHLQNG